MVQAVVLAIIFRQGFDEGGLALDLRELEYGVDPLILHISDFFSRLLLDQGVFIASSLHEWCLRSLLYLIKLRAI